MATQTAQSRKAGSGRPARKSRWLFAGAGILTIAAIGLITASLLYPRGQGADGGPTGMSPNFDLDPDTGKIRDRGLIPCDRLSMQNGRIDLIREGFKGR
jgi:hypothetical protein